MNIALLVCISRIHARERGSAVYAVGIDPSTALKYLPVHSSQLSFRDGASTFADNTRVRTLMTIVGPG